MSNYEKTLTELIEETIGEIDDLRKSRFAAAEIQIGGPGEGIAGKPSNGDLEAKKSEDEVEKKEDKEEDKKEDKEEDKEEKDEICKKEDKDEDEDDKDEDVKDMKKSLDESEELLKSYVDARVCSLEEKLTGIAEMVASLADQPVERNGIPAGIVPLHKSQSEIAPLSKTELADKLFDLKKSGNTEVDSADIIRVETGSNYDMEQIATKYGLR